MALKRKVAIKWKGKEPIEWKEEEITPEEIKQRQIEGFKQMQETGRAQAKLQELGHSIAAAERLAPQELVPKREALKRQEEIAGLKVQMEKEIIAAKEKKTELPTVEEGLAELSEEEQKKFYERKQIARRTIAEPAILGRTAAQVQTTKGIITEAKSVAAEILTNLGRAIFSGKEPLKQNTAKDSFRAATAILQRNVDDVKAGGDYINARRDFDESLAAIYRLQSATKGIGQINLDWFVDDGIHVEVAIANEISLLNDLRRELELAKQESEIRKIKERYTGYAAEYGGTIS